jgi:MFS family permease
MIAWGLVMTLMCLVDSFRSLVVCVELTHTMKIYIKLCDGRARLFLGLTEAGLFPGVTYYISLWYPRSEQSKRIAIFFSAATVAGKSQFVKRCVHVFLHIVWSLGAFGGLLA